MSCQGYIIALLLLVTTAVASNGQTQKNIKPKISLIGNDNRTPEFAEKQNMDVCSQNECTSMERRIVSLEQQQSSTMKKMEVLEQNQSSTMKKMEVLEQKQSSTMKKMEVLEQKQSITMKKMEVMEQKQSSTMKKMEVLEQKMKDVLTLKDLQMLSCHLGIDGNWGEWTLWSPCSVSCGGGNHTRSRSCDKPRPAGRGLKCMSLHGTRVIFENVTNVCKSHTCPGRLENLAIGKAAQLSSTHSGSYGAERAVDGNLATCSGSYYYIAWWRVDIGKAATIYKIRDYPVDHTDVTLTTVYIGNNVNVTDMTRCGTFNIEGGIKRREGRFAYDITCENPLVGRYIQVNNNCDHHHFEIREFEVYGQYI